MEREREKGHTKKELSRIVYIAFIANEPIYLIGGERGRGRRAIKVKPNRELRANWMSHNFN